MRTFQLADVFLRRRPPRPTECFQLSWIQDFFKEFMCNRLTTPKLNRSTFGAWHYDKIEVSKKVSVCKHVRKPVCKFPFKFTLQNHCVSC